MFLKNFLWLFVFYDKYIMDNFRLQICIEFLQAINNW
jgi:hypothetical protein